MTVKLARAFCWGNGVIDIGTKVPEGALPCASPVPVSYQTELRKQLEVYARHAYDGEVLLVPGVPEREGSQTAVDFLLAFKARMDWAMSRVRYGIGSPEDAFAFSEMLNAEARCKPHLEAAL